MNWWQVSVNCFWQYPYWICWLDHWWSNQCWDQIRSKIWTGFHPGIFSRTWSTRQIFILIFCAQWWARTVLWGNHQWNWRTLVSFLRYCSRDWQSFHLLWTHSTVWRQQSSLFWSLILFRWQVASWRTIPESFKRRAVLFLRPRLKHFLHGLLDRTQGDESRLKFIILLKCFPEAAIWRHVLFTQGLPRRCTWAFIIPLLNNFRGTNLLPLDLRLGWTGVMQGGGGRKALLL